MIHNFNLLLENAVDIISTIDDIKKYIDQLEEKVKVDKSNILNLFITINENKTINKPTFYKEIKNFR